METVPVHRMALARAGVPGVGHAKLTVIGDDTLQNLMDDDLIFHGDPLELVLGENIT